MKKLAVITAVVLLNIPAAALARWVEARTENFIVISDASEKEVREFALELEEYRYIIARLTGMEFRPEPFPVRVYAFRSAGTFDRSFYFDAAAGVYSSNLDQPVFIAYTGDPETEIDLDGETIIKHEYVHHYTYSNSPANYPAWYREGIADFFATLDYEDGKVILGKIIPGRAFGLKYERWLDWEVIFDSKGSFRTRDDYATSQAYAQSWITIHYLQLTPERRAQLPGYLADIRSGLTADEAISKNFGVSKQELGDEIRAYFKKGTIPLLTLAFPDLPVSKEVAIRKLDKLDDDFHLAYASSFFGQSDSDAAKAFRKTNIGRFERYLEKRPEDLLARRTVAEAYLFDQEYAAARAQLAAMKELDPAHPLTALCEGLILMAEYDNADNKQDVNGVRQARALFEAARKADAKLARAHYEFARTWYITGDDVTQEVVNAIQTADDLSAENFDVPFLYAALIGRAGYAEDAKAILVELFEFTENEERRARIRREIARL